MNPRRLLRPRRPSLERARRHLLAHYREKVALDELAAIAGLSRFHFARAFARAFGASPHAYQIHLRIRELQSRLARGSLVDARALGFADRSHLIRHFRRIVGTTPAAYAARRRGKQQ